MMKKNSAILATSIVLTAGTVFAADDWTILGTVAPGATVIREITLPEGLITLEVIPNSPDYKMTCKFGQFSKDSIVQENTNHCLVKNFNWQSVFLDAKITNLNSKILNYKIWIHKD
jgi:hypothetical protein